MKSYFLKTFFILFFISFLIGCSDGKDKNYFVIQKPQFFKILISSVNDPRVVLGNKYYFITSLDSVKYDAFSSNFYIPLNDFKTLAGVNKDPTSDDTIFWYPVDKLVSSHFGGSYIIMFDDVKTENISSLSDKDK